MQDTGAESCGIGSWAGHSFSFLQFPSCYFYYTNDYYQSSIFSLNRLPYITVLSTARDASVGSTPQVCPSAMLILTIVKSEKYDFRVCLNGIRSVPDFIQMCPAVLDLNCTTDRWTDGQTDVTSPMCDHFVHIVERTPNNASTLFWGSTITGIFSFLQYISLLSNGSLKLSDHSVFKLN